MPDIPSAEPSWLVKETYNFTFTLTFNFIKTLKMQNASMCEVQSLKSLDTGKVRDDRKAIIQNLAYRKISLHRSGILSLSRHMQLLNSPPLHIKCTQHLSHTDDSRSGVKMFFRVVILVFAAISCTARVIGKSLHTRQ